MIVIPNLTRGGTPYALIENVVTFPSHRGKRFGTLVLYAATERAWQHGSYRVMLSTGPKTCSTLAFYKRVGLEQPGTGFPKRCVASRPD
nr:GNAT family N-acetyltransferase [Ruegeria sp. PrR005]